MYDKDKLIIVIYACVRGMNKMQSIQCLCNIRAKYENYFDDSVKLMVFPVEDEETHVDVLNPKVILSSQDIIDEITKIVNIPLNIDDENLI